MIAGLIFYVGFMVLTAIGFVVVTIGKIWEYLLLLVFLYLCTQVSLADEPRSQLVIITRTDFVAEGERVPHADCLKAGAEYMRTADGDVIGFLCEPEVIVAVCKDPAENCA